MLYPNFPSDLLPVPYGSDIIAPLLTETFKNSPDSDINNDDC